MTREALLRELRKTARQMGTDFEVVTDRGKGSHYRVRLGGRETTIKSGELRPGYVKLIKAQFGVEQAGCTPSRSRSRMFGDREMEYRYWAAVQPDEDGFYLVTFPDVPEAITQGDDLSDAKRNAAEALGLALRGYLARGKALPRPAASGAPLTEISVDPGDAVKMAVIEAFQASGIPKSELARRLGKGENEARRILDPDHPTRLDTLTAALAALGKRVTVSIRDAA